MKKLLILLSFFSFLSLGAQTSLFQEANALYQQEKYEEAEALYDSIVSSGLISAELYFNLGNAQYKNGKVAPCILSYERALQLSPDDEDIHYNLELVQQHVVDEIEAVDVFFLKKLIIDIRNSRSSDAWGMISLISFFIALLGFALFLLIYSRALKRSGFYVGILCLFIAFVTLSFSRKNKYEMTAHEGAIVLAPTVTVTSSPNENGTPLFVIHEGAKVSITDQLDNWIEIKLSDGNKGWVKAEMIEAI